MQNTEEFSHTLLKDLCIQLFTLERVSFINTYKH